jgi:hypothetical protein
MSSGLEQNKKSRQFFRHDETDCNLVSDLNMASAIEPKSGDVADDPPADVVAADPKVETDDVSATDLDMAPNREAESDSEDIARAAVWSKKVTKPESEWSKKVTDATTKPSSKKVTRRFRCSDSIDSEIIKRIQQFEVCLEAPLGTSLHFTPIKAYKRQRLTCVGADQGQAKARSLYVGLAGVRQVSCLMDA